MALRGRRIVWNQTMLNVLASGVRKKENPSKIAEKLGVSRTTVNNKITKLRGEVKTTTPKSPELTGNVTLVHKNFTMTSKGSNVTITINQ
tara:strand:+ start:3298 stop:3567 length:270 start_codon:yes stop_codon:yes gene_type:complete